MTDIDISPEAVEPPCTCHPDDAPPKPCQQKYALPEWLALEKGLI